MAGETRFLVWAPKARRVQVHLLDAARALCAAEAARAGLSTPAWLPTFRRARAISIASMGGLERPDPASHFQPEGVHGPSEVVDPSFEWHDSAWRRAGAGRLSCSMSCTSARFRPAERLPA